MEGHEALVLGPQSGMTSYAGHEVVGTKGIPLLGVYKGLKLNFLRPKFIRKLMAFKPDVIQFVDPIWLGAQTLPAVQFWLPNTPLLTSYHTNLAMYATLFGFSWLTPTIWSLQLNLHGRCSLTYCPSPSTERMLTSQGFNNVRLWPRGVDTGLFRPTARDMALRQAWGAEPTETSPSASSKVVLLYVGRISWEKNLRLLVESARGLELPSGSRRACQLVFVGDGPSKSELEALCASYELGAVFMGHRGGEELARCFASADIFAFPSWTETFGQVVLESLASGLPVVGLRAEGVVDLVKDGETGLLLDLDDLIPTTTASSIASPSATFDSTPRFKPLPANPHSLVDKSCTTFPLAVSIYRSLLVDLATDDQRRETMGRAAALDASSRSWHGAMELLVDGYREIALPLPDSPSGYIPLSRTASFEKMDDLSLDNEPFAESTAASKRRGVGRVLRIGGALRRNAGGRLKKSGTMFWKTQAMRKESGARIKPLSSVQSNLWATRWLIKCVLISYVFYYLFAWAIHSEVLAPFLSL